MDWVLVLVAILYVLANEYRLGKLRAQNRRLQRRLTGLGYAVLLGLGTPGTASALPFPRHAYARTQQHPDAAVVDALVFLETKVPRNEWCFWRFFHWLPIAPEDLADDLGNFKAYLQMLNGTAPGPVRAIPIDREGRVWAVDRREAGWSAAAFHAVAVLDNTCREPNVDPQLAAELRQAIGVEVEDSHTPHCEGLVPGYWFVREVQETNRHKNDPENIAYYNLLYSRERFGDDFDALFVDKADVRRSKPPEKSAPAAFEPFDAEVALDRAVLGDERGQLRSTLSKGIRVRVVALDRGDKSGEPIAQVTIATSGGGSFGGYVRFKELTRLDGKVTEAGPRVTEKRTVKSARGNGFIDRNFPLDADQFRERWGTQAVIDFQNKQRVFLFNGTVIAGGFNDLKNGSVVSDNDRVNRFFNGPLGLAMETNDFEKTAGRNNLVNNPLGVSIDDLNEDASEKIYQKQDGFPVFWLNGPKKAGSKRVEAGDPDVVHDRINGGKVTVQTLHKCIGCHYPSDMVLAPSNEKFVEGLRRQRGAMEAFNKSKGAQLTIDRFFFDGDAAGERWRWKLEDWRRPFARSLTNVTRTVAEPKGWSGTKFAAASNSRRDWYDAPIRFGQAAAELGYPRVAVMAACLLLNDFDAQQLFLDAEDWPGVPRDAWDLDLLPRLAYTLAAARDLEFFGELFAPSYDARVNPHHVKK